MRKIRWGVLSTARIGIEVVLPALQRSRHCHVAALASRSLDKARAAAGRLGIDVSYGSYEELLADERIDAIYNPLPNHLHVPWSLKALAAGKHVLCEKPIGLSSAEGQQLLDAAAGYPHLKVMEAFMYRHHPQWQAARQLVRDGSIGALKTVQSFFSFHDVDPSSICNQADLGGGGLMDIGCYSISLSRFLFDAMPERVSGIVEYDPQLKTDRLASAILDFGRGTSTFTCSTQLAPHQRVSIFGSDGRIEIEVPFNPPPDVPSRIWLQRGSETTELQFEICDQYTIQGDLFSSAILNDADVPTPLRDAVDNMMVIEAVIASSKAGTWVRP